MIETFLLDRCRRHRSDRDWRACQGKFRFLFSLRIKRCMSTNIAKPAHDCHRASRGVLFQSRRSVPRRPLVLIAHRVAGQGVAVGAQRSRARAALLSSGAEVCCFQPLSISQFFDLFAFDSKSVSRSSSHRPGQSRTALSSFVFFSKFKPVS